MRLPRPTSLCSPGCGLSSALSRGSRTRGAKLATSKAPTAAARSPLEGYFATASRRESDPFPQPGLGAYKGTLWDPAAKIAPGQVARNSNLKFGVRPSTLAIKQPMRIKTPTKANINAAVINSAGRPIPGTRGQGAGPEISLAGSLRKNRGRVRVAPASTTSCRRYTSRAPPMVVAQLLGR